MWHCKTMVRRYPPRSLPRAFVCQSSIGFIPWRPNAEYLKLVDDIKEVLTEYRAHLAVDGATNPLPANRAYGYTKDETFEMRCYNACKRARRARMVDMDAIHEERGVRRGRRFGLMPANG